MPAVERGFTVTHTTSHYVYGRYDGVRVRVSVDEACNVTPKIFAYRMLPVDPNTGAAEGHFSHICSSVDLAEYPEDAPVPGASPQWFRLSYVDVILRSWAEALDFIDVVYEDIRSLKDSLDNMDEIVGVTEITIGAVCPQSSSSSSVSSSSSSSVEQEYESFVTVAVPAESRGFGAGVQWVDAAVTLPGGGLTQVLLMYGFDFTEIPADAVIRGIIISPSLRWADNEASLSSASASASATDYCPELIYATPHHPEQGMGSDPLSSVCVSGPAFENYEYGAADDLWGQNWTVGDVMRGEFGIALVVRADTLPGEVPIEASLENSSITIHYDVPV
jgi:hypothetical protein